MENFLAPALAWYIVNGELITYFLFIICFVLSFLLHRLQSKTIDTQQRIIALHEKTTSGILTSYFEHFVKSKKTQRTLDEVREVSKKKNLAIYKMEKRALIYQNVSLSMQLGNKGARFSDFQRQTNKDLRTMIENKKKALKETKKEKNILQESTKGICVSVERAFKKVKENIGQNMNKK